MLTIRKATPADAALLARLAEQTFRDTFAPDNTAANMDAHCREAFGEAIQAAEIAAPNRTNLLMEEGGEFVGFSQLRWRPAPACVTGRSPGEIQRFYIVKGWHGRGLAAPLMNACLAEARARGSDVVWLGVWERNPRAISFYRKFGFTEVGDHVFVVGDDPQRDIIMSRPLV